MIDNSSKNKSHIKKQSQTSTVSQAFFYYVILLFKAPPLQWLDIICVAVHTDTLWSAGFLLDFYLLVSVPCFFFFFTPDCVRADLHWHWNSAVMKIRLCWIHSLLVLLGCLAPVLRLLGKSDVVFSQSVHHSARHSLETSEQQLNTPGKTWLHEWLYIIVWLEV